MYYSDTHQPGMYVDGYHALLDRRLGAVRPATEMTTEVLVPRAALGDFLGDAAEQLRADTADVVGAAVRLLEAEGEWLLAWAREPWACVAFDIHTAHTVEGLARLPEAARWLIDLAREHGGSYTLGYSRYARRDQVLACHPRLPAFLRHQREGDPGELFQSEWYRHFAALLAAELDGDQLEVAA